LIAKITLPIWEGTYKLPDKGNVKEFSLFFNEKIKIYQQCDITKTFYENDDYTFITSPPGSSRYANKLGDLYINRISDFIKDITIENILEIGAGSYYLAKGINKNNPYKLATLIDPAIKKTSSRKIKIIKDYYPSKVIKNKKFDFIYSINTLEHVLNPEEFLLEVRNNISEDGLVFFIFPNIEEQFSRGDIGSLLHEHINYFDYNSAKFLFEKCGFLIVNELNINDEITFLCKKIQLPCKNKIQNNNKEIFIPPNLFSQMLAKIETNKEKILSLHSKGLKIGFHGACNALSNFLYLSKLYKNKDFYIFDGDESKTNTYLPLSSNKILLAGNDVYKEIDILFISASTFAKEIRNYANKFIDPNNIWNLFE